MNNNKSFKVEENGIVFWGNRLDENSEWFGGVIVNGKSKISGFYRCKGSWEECLQVIKFWA